MKKYNIKTCMRDLSITQLENILGKTLIETLMEWTSEDETIRSKSKLIEMILAIKGYEILKDKNFRKLILSKLEAEDIISFNLFLSQKEKTNDLTKLLEVISNKSFGKNSVTKYILDFFDIQENEIFVDEKEIEAVSTLKAYDNFYDLLDYQFVIKQKILKIIESDIPVPRVLVHMPTGTGKTKTTMHTIIHHFNFNIKQRGVIIWLAHTTELLEQACETLEKTWLHLGMAELKLYRLWGKQFPEIDPNTSIDGFIVCGFQKMILIKENNPELYNRLCIDCRVIVVDEAHKSVAPETKKIINGLMLKKAGMENRALIGLTATPGRNFDDDSENKKLVNMFENRIVSIDIDVLNRIELDKFNMENSSKEKDVIKYLQGRKILSKIKRERLTYDYSFTEKEIEKIKIQALENGYLDFTNEALKIISLNKKRNIKILSKLIELESKKIPTIVFACSVEHGKLISSFLTLRGIKSACIYGNMNPTLRQKYIKRFKDSEDALNILINYEVLTTGFDATNIKCVFITRPTKSIVLYSQMIGRGLRGPLMGGNEECLLIDIEDNLDAYTDESMAFNYFNNYWGR